MSTGAMGLRWKVSRLSVQEGPDGVVAKGLLSVIREHTNRQRYIPYGAFATTRALAIEKAISEMVERVVWFIGLTDIQENGGFSGLYLTVGWSAHMDDASAQLKSLGEYLEHQYLPNVMQDLANWDSESESHFLGHAHVIELGYKAGPLEGPYQVEGAMAVPLYFPQISLHVVYVLAVVCVAEDLAAGVILGMGSGVNLDRAMEAARFEVTLVSTSLRRGKSKLPSIYDENSVGAYDIEYFTRLYNDAELLQRLRHAIAYCRKPSTDDHDISVISWPISPSGETIVTVDFSWLQPDWVRSFHRRVCYASSANDYFFSRLASVYGSMVNSNITTW